MLTDIPHADPPEPATDDHSRWSVAGPGDLAPIRASIATLTAARDRIAPLIGSGSASSGDSGSLGAVPMLASVNERMAIVFSELATNALRHGAPPVSATVHRSRDGWVVIVEDAARDEAPTLRPSDADGGHGLRLIARLARAVGWCVRGARKSVWAEVGHEPPRELLQQLAGISGGDTPVRWLGGVRAVESGPADLEG